MEAASARAALRGVLQGQVVLAPLTRGGNLPFRRLVAGFGARVTYSEMAIGKLLVRGGSVERALVRHHPDEAYFGVQLAARDPEVGARAARLAVEAGAKFVDLNCGCPIHQVVARGEGAALLEKPRRLEKLLAGLREALPDTPLTVKLRTGFHEGKENVLEIARLAEGCGVDAIAVHGRTREQRYRRPADWERIAEVARSVSVPVIGNGDILHARDARRRLAESGCVAVMAGRGALIKPWLWEDVLRGEDRPRGAEERLATYRRWVQLAIEQWRADEKGAKRIRHFLEFHVDFWRRYCPEDAEVDGENTLQGRSSFAPRDELEALLQAPDDEGIARACDVILEGFDLHPIARQPSEQRRDPTAGGWS